VPLFALQIMPNIEMFVVEGYSDQQKEALVAALTHATVEAIDSVRVWLTEVSPRQFGVAGKSLAALGVPRARQG